MLNTVLTNIPSICDIPSQLATMTLLVPRIIDTDTALCERATTIMLDTVPAIIAMEKFYDVYTTMRSFLVAVNSFPEAVRSQLLQKMADNILAIPRPEKSDRMFRIMGAFICAIDDEKTKDIHNDVVKYLNNSHYSFIHQNLRFYLKAMSWFFSACHKQNQEHLLFPPIQF